MSAPSNEERLLRELAGDVTRLMDEADKLREALAESERARQHWVDVAVEQQLRLCEAWRLVRSLRDGRERPTVALASALRVLGPRDPGPTLGEPGDDAAEGQERAA